MPPDYIASREKARLKYEAARHILQVTFPLVKDPKLLIGVIGNLIDSYEHAIDTILKFERQLRLIPIYNENFQSKFNIFRSKSVKRNRIPSEYIILLMKLKEIQELQKSCPMEFQRGNRYVLASKDYRLNILSIKDIKEYVDQTEKFLNIVDRIIRL